MLLKFDINLEDANSLYNFFWLFQKQYEIRIFIYRFKVFIPCIFKLVFHCLH